MKILYKENLFREQVFNDEAHRMFDLCQFSWGDSRIMCESGDCSICRIPQYVLMRNALSK